MSSLKDARIRTTIPPLTPRQREVLELLARGYSNPQIGGALGISLDGAKWHVAEILARLGVDSREEAAAYWRDYNRPTARLARFARAFVPVAGWAKWGAAVAGVGAVSAIAAVTVVAMNGGNGGPPLASVASATASVAAMSSASSTASAVAVVSSATASVTASGAPPTPSPTPSLERTGIRTVDNAIAAMEARDFDALAEQLLTQEIVCPPYQQTDGPVASCEAASQGNGGETRAAYTYGECDGPQHFAAETAALSFAQHAGLSERLYGVTKNPDGTYRIIFEDDTPNAFTLTLNGQGITAVGRACGASADTVLNAAGPASVVYLAPGTPEPPSSAGLTGIQPVDRAIATMQAQDFAALVGQLVTHEEPCGLNPPPEGWLSPCAPGVATGTQQQVYLVNGCDSPTWMPTSNGAADIAAMLSGSKRLYGVRQNPDSTYSLVYADDNESAFTLTVADSGITALGCTCGVPAPVVLPAGGTIIAGPFE